MKRAFAIGLIASMALGIHPAISVVAVKPGALCKKEGQVKNAAGKKFTCIKKGGKFVWNKGVPNKTSTAAATPTVTPSPITSSSPAPTPAPAPTRTATPSPNDAVQKAIDNFSQYPKVKRPIPPFNFLIGPKADARVTEIVKKVSNETLALFMDFYDDTRPYPVIYDGGTDPQWVFDQWKLLGYTDEMFNIRGNKNDVRNRLTTSDHVAVVYWMGAQGFFTFIMPIETAKKQESMHPTLFPKGISHHIVHAVQQRLTGDKYELLPCWANEGGAEFYGQIALTRNEGADYRGPRSAALGGWTRTEKKADPRLFSDREWLALLKSFDTAPCQTVGLEGLHYSLGMVMMEYLVASFGHESVMNWWLEMRSTNDWKTGFQKVFKISSDDWYTQSLIPYLKEQYLEWKPSQRS